MTTKTEAAFAAWQTAREEAEKAMNRLQAGAELFFDGKLGQNELRDYSDAAKRAVRDRDAAETTYRKSYRAA